MLKRYEKQGASIYSSLLQRNIVILGLIVKYMVYKSLKYTETYTKVDNVYDVRKHTNIRKNNVIKCP